MTASESYDVFAAVYDQPEHAMVTTAFWQRLTPLLEGLPARSRVLDLGCGTGMLSAHLLRRGFSVYGVDGSRAMLQIARRRCAHLGAATFVKKRLDATIAGGRFALAVACGDVVNHLAPGPALLKFAVAAKRALGPDGRLVFDSLRRFCFEAYWDRRTYLLEGRTGELVMHCSWDPQQRTGTARMIAYVKHAGGLRHRRESVLREYLHTDREIRAALKRGGFRHVCVSPWSPWPDQHLEPEQDRTFWVAW